MTLSPILSFLRQCLSHWPAEGLRFDYVTFDEEYGKVPDFLFELDRLGQPSIGEVPANFRVWVKKPACKSNRAEHASHRADKIASHSPAFYGQSWRKMVTKDTTRGQCIWHVKSTQVYLVKHKDGKAHCPIPTDRTYWLIVANNRHTGEIKYFVSNAPAKAKIEMLMEIAFSRWQVEKWFERAKQECGFGAFEVRTYTSLIRHWLASRLAMYFLADQTTWLRKKNPQITLEQVADVANTLAWKIWQKYPYSWEQKAYVCEYYQERNEASYASRRKTAKERSIEFL